MKKKAYCYKINLHFLFLTAICHKGGKFLEIQRFFSIFFAGINFRSFNKIEYFAGTNFCDFGPKTTKISTTKVFTIPKIQPHKDRTSFQKLVPIEIFLFLVPFSGSNNSFK